MYEDYYGFREKPFNLTPDPKYLYLSRRHTEAFAHLEFGRRERGGFAVITGEVGTGKTTLARYFLSRLGEKTATAVVLYPALSAAELLRSILDDLHVEAPGSSLKELVDALHRFLLASRAEGRDVVLLIDEAQDLSAEVLEQIRLISNLETDTEKLIQIVLMGQSELHEMLGRRELRQLAQRVSARYHLSPLDRQEVEEYVRHRLAVAGGEGKATFTASALASVHRLSSGVPRLVNLICDRALLAGYVQGTRTIDGGMVRRAAREVGGLGIAPRVRPSLYAVLGAALAVAAVLAARGMPAAPSTPVSAPVPQATSAPPSAPLESVLRSLPHDASLVGAIAQVESLWGAGLPLERTTLRTHMDQVRGLDMPVVLEMFHPARRDTCYVALLRIEGAEAVLGSEGREALRVPLSEVDRLWTRQAVFLWRDHEAVAHASEPDRSAAWVSQALARLGYLGQDGDVAAAVARFQQHAELVPDGVAGSRTLLAMYAALDYKRPRLARGPS